MNLKQIKNLLKKRVNYIINKTTILIMGRTENLNDKFTQMDMSLSKFRDWLIGKHVRILRNTNSHNYGRSGDCFTIGSNVNVKTVGTSSRPKLKLHRAREDGTGNNIYARDLELISMSKSDLLERKEEIQKEYNEKMQELDTKIKFLEETGLEEFDAQEYKIYKVLGELDSNTSRSEKARAIKKLIS